MKKILLAILGLSLATSSLARTNIIKPIKYGEVSDSGDSVEVKTAKGSLWIYQYGMDEKSAGVLVNAMKKKTCVKVVDDDLLNTKITPVKCPTTLKPIKQG